VAISRLWVGYDAGIQVISNPSAKVMHVMY